MMTVHFDSAAFAASLERTCQEAEELLVDELLVAVGDLAVELSARWPRRTGRSAEAFEASPLPRGARLSNPVPYVPYVHRRGVPTLALDELGGPLLEAATEQIPERAAAAVARRLA